MTSGLGLLMDKLRQSMTELSARDTIMAGYYKKEKKRKKGKRKVQGVSQSQIAALPRHQVQEETDKSKQAQIEQTYEKH